MKRAAGIVLLIAIVIALLINGVLVCIHHTPKDVSMAKSLVNKIEYMK
jgi:hypothetical protein